MPLIFRSMFRDGDRPKVGTQSKCLGARIPGDLPENDGLVAPGTGGISVGRSWRDLPAWHIPIRFIHLEPRASGRNRDVSLWRMGEGPFEAGGVADGLSLRPDSDTHGLVEPSEPMSTGSYQAALAATRDLWECVDEELIHE